MKHLLSVLLFTTFTLGSYAQNAGYSLDFDGTNDYVDLDTSSAYHPAYLTVEAWINADAWRTSNWQGTILSTDTWSGTGGQRGWNMRTGDNGRVTLLIAQGTTGTWMECMSAQIMSTSKWYHVAGIYDGQTQKVYINGQLVQTLTNTGGIRYNGMDKMLMGDCTGQIGSRVFDGKIDEVRVWNVALDTTTLREWMFKPVTSSHPQYSNRIAYYKVTEATGTTTYDSSGYGHNGILTNFSTTPRLSSYAPLASTPSNCLNNVTSVWPVNNSASSSILTVKDTITANAYIVFGHNNGALSYNSYNKPSIIKNKLSRYWRIEKEGTLTGTILFNYSGLDTTGFYTYKLLSDNDSNFSNATVISGVKKGNNIIAFYNISFQDSTFYTLGAYDYQPPSVETKSIDEVKAFSVKVTGNVSLDGGKTTTRGICWSTSPNPDTTLTTKALSGTGTGPYQINITGLSQNTKYYFRAFAYNSLGVTYGTDLFDTTLIASVPTVKNVGSLSVKADTIIYRGNVTSDGNVTVTERGFCWSTSANPTTSSNKLIVGSGTGVFDGMITGLTPNTLYHIRSYAINSIGTSYGGDSVVTSMPISAPTVITGNITSVMGNSVNVAGQIPFDGRRIVTQKGFCWDLTANPTTALSTKSTQGGGTSPFNYNITGLSRNTNYHVRAYATNAVGTSYGGDSTFLTADAPTTVITSITAVSYYTANINASITNDGRKTVTSRGVCWSTSPDPDLKTASSKAGGSGTGAFIVSLSGLTNNTTYYVKSYAINIIDTAYSTQDTFKTVKTGPPIVITTSPKTITSKGATCGGNVTADGGATVTLRGVCWSLNPNPTAKLPTRSVNGSGLGTYSYIITTLSQGTTYHVRAYAINSADTSYGGDSIFTTLDIPKLTLDSVFTIDANSVKCKSAVSTDGGSPVTKRGICWDTKPGPLATLPTSTSDGTGTGQFSSTATSFIYGITYYIRAYATNTVGTAYSAEYTYVPIIVNTKTAVTSITAYTAACGGKVVSGKNITQRGVVWSINPNPSISLLTKTSDGMDTGSYTSNITGLNPKTLYHVRAYATNENGTAYGSDISFTTVDKLAVTTGTITITASSIATCDGNVTTDGGLTVTGRGISWSDDSTNVLLLQNKTADGTGTGTFVGSLSGLAPYSLYYVRAYAINGADTAFGIQKSFTISPPQSITGTTSDITKSSAIIHGSANAMGISTNCYFEYGLTTTYGNTASSIPPTLNDNTLHSVSAALNGLTNSTTYHYRLVAESSHGKTVGADSVFITGISSIQDRPSISEAIISTSSSQLKVEITMQGWKEAEVVVTDLSGKEIIRQKNFGNVFTTDLPLAQAVYLVNLNIDEKQYAQKIMIR